MVKPTCSLSREFKLLMGNLHYLPWQVKVAASALILTPSNKRWILCPLLLNLDRLCDYLLEYGVSEVVPVSWPRS